ncbi:hypothetical protein B0I72DRAFT_140475 [Yarrowia lipolytica]|nr:hypothetical protein BKA91DRAFT_133435 [Yarrowia lipolytica]KAE8174853.1 hypothetical protein BKA90DRAFT_133028 [Yarrowia lipolytica]RDW31059.1 hypothetical protein B0I72DRAFT_140475 [Yarrowia lipolytica]RDW43941.1 hypothetical protein B0I74DRAFT_141228 [Yarrowia lipolytica]RDW50652.1 hypothetical protein B0I75DRAFT_141152 [Yarrowia lipolytica]
MMTAPGMGSWRWKHQLLFSLVSHWNQRAFLHPTGNSKTSIHKYSSTEIPKYTLAIHHQTHDLRKTNSVERVYSGDRNQQLEGIPQLSSHKILH